MTGTAARPPSQTGIDSAPEVIKKACLHRFRGPSLNNKQILSDVCPIKSDTRPDFIPRGIEGKGPALETGSLSKSNELRTKNTRKHWASPGFQVQFKKFHVE